MLTGYKTYIAALGLFGLGIYHISQGDMAGGIGSLSAALGAFGIRNAIADVAPKGGTDAVKS